MLHGFQVVPSLLKCLTISFILDPNENFEVFLANCGKNYADELEMDRRRGIFEKNVEIIREANRAFDAGQLSYELRVNCFGDLALEEFARENLGLGLLSKFERIYWAVIKHY